ncbi:MAG: DUF1365 domain-containing protein [Oleiphilaceae bacterium]|nr:DUF1365 domain-containing protein [Oleiphilaceae bacterium]
MSTRELKSCLYHGHIRHRRFEPISHAFKYSMFMWYLDLDEIDEVTKKLWFFRLGKFGIASFDRSDYFNQSADHQDDDLKQCVIKKVNAFYTLNQRHAPTIQSVRLLANVRYFGVIFNPVSFYYCFDENERLTSILAEITNTPWDERHSYVLPIADGKLDYQSFDDAVIEVEQLRETVSRFSFSKAFHVSPFNPMNMEYNWVFKTPGEGLSVHMDNTIERSDASVEKHFDATMGLHKEGLEHGLNRLLKQPLMTVKVVLGIYWQALKLWIKRSPFYDHPDSVSDNQHNNNANSAL